MDKKKMIPVINYKKCMSCRVCILACPFSVLDDTKTDYGKLKKTFPEIVNVNACTGCAICAKSCPIGIISMEDIDKTKAKPMSAIGRIGYKIYQTFLKIYICSLRIKETVIINEAGSTGKVGQILKENNHTNVLIVTDKNLVKLKLLDTMLDGMKQNEIEYTIYDGVVPNPTIANIEAAKNLYLKNKCQAIVAFGGGSPMDCAKMTGVVAISGKSPKRYDLLIPMIGRNGVLYAVPTTAGSGSEVTISAVVTDEESHKKFAVTDPKLSANYAILDANVFIGLPKNITAETGMDALTHAVEAYVGRWRFKKNNEYAIKATKLIFENIETAYNNGSDINARTNMAVASTYAGYAFRTGGVGYVHGVAHRLSELYSVSHGLANATVLPHVLENDFEYIYKQLAKLAKEVLIEGDNERDLARKFIDKIKALKVALEIPEYSKDIKYKDIKLIAKRAREEANKTYPISNPMKQKKMEKFVRSLMLK